MTPSAWLIWKKKKPSEGQSDQLHLSIYLSSVCMANFSLCFCSSLTSWGWINPPVREEPGSAARDQGSSPSLYRVTHPIPPARFTTVLGAPPALRRQYRDDSPDDDSKWFSRQKWSFECQMLKTRGPPIKTFSGSQQGFGQLKRLLTMKSWRFNMLIESAQITLIVETSFKKKKKERKLCFIATFTVSYICQMGYACTSVQSGSWWRYALYSLQESRKGPYFNKLGISFPTNWTFKGCFFPQIFPKAVCPGVFCLWLIDHKAKSNLRLFLGGFLIFTCMHRAPV